MTDELKKALDTLSNLPVSPTFTGKITPILTEEESDVIKKLISICGALDNAMANGDIMSISLESDGFVMRTDDYQNLQERLDELAESCPSDPRTYSNPASNARFALLRLIGDDQPEAPA